MSHSPRVLSLTFVGLSPVALAVTLALVNTTEEDFVQPGSQPDSLTDEILEASVCAGCHAGYAIDEEPFYRWAGSMMAQSMRDPIFHACLAVAEQDAEFVGDLCIRCHSPGGWLEGRSTPTDGSALTGKDFDGVSCHFCHRLVDPVEDLVNNPASDAGILASLAQVPGEPHSGQFVVDPLDRRRGPFDLGPSFPWHAVEHSPFHQESLLCATCHDVSNPAYTRVGGATPSASDTYVLNDVDTQHPTHNKFDEFPVERTFSEWANSAFAVAPVDMGGRFGGNKLEVSTCQDCHMPDTSGVACAPPLGGTYRTDLPQHDFSGANTWVPLSVFDLDQSLELYGAGDASGYPIDAFQHAVGRNIAMLEAASDTTVTQEGSSAEVRVINESGHKLPSGYPEGRRMWLNVRFYDALGGLVGEHGAYDAFTADLTTTDTVVYEAQLGLSPDVALATGLPAGESFHFALNNTYVKDNRIPPRGFSNAAFEAIQAAPVGATYADGEHWDDSQWELPCGTASVEVTLNYQTTSKEYIEFLRDENTTNDAGDIAYAQWEDHGKSAPVAMDEVTLQLDPWMKGDAQSISVSAGGTQSLCINAGPAHAGKLYVVLGSVSGTSPGFVLGSSLIPLNLDSYTLLSIKSANKPPLVNSAAFLDGNGLGQMDFALAAGSPPALAGLSLNHAFIVLTGTVVDAASNAVPLGLVP